MRALDLTNQKFGELTAISTEKQKDKRGWLCKCTCGAFVWYATFQLTAGNAKTCGAEIHRHSIKINDRFGKLIVTKIKRDVKNNRFLAECLCDCGKTKLNATFKDLQRGTTTHCGCSRNLSNLGLPPGEALINRLIHSYKANARKKDLDFNLTREDCIKLFKGNCWLCNEPPSRKLTYKNTKGEIYYSGIDRRDSTKGYILTNVSSCCTECNYLKSNLPEDMFVNRVLKIAAHQNDTHSS